MPTRHLTLHAACALLALTGCNAAPEPATLDTIDWAARQPVYPVGESMSEEERQAQEAVDAAARAALQTKVSPDFDGATLESVFDYLRDTAGVDFVINWPALEISDIDQDSPVTMELTDASAQRILQLALEQVSAQAFDDEKAGYAIRDGFVYISTLHDQKTYTLTRLYDVSDLIYSNPVLTASLYDDFESAEQMLQLLQQGDAMIDVPVFDLNDALS